LSLAAAQRITCGPGEPRLGKVAFTPTGSAATAQTFRLGLALLHSFEYEEAEKVFAELISHDPQCAMAYWGVAMSVFHPLWAPPSATELRKGELALRLAKEIKDKSLQEAAYINALWAFYENWPSLDHRSRCLRLETAMQNLSSAYPADKEAATLNALALTAAADPKDQTFAKQKKAGALLTALYRDNPDHPGVVHYLIHAYDVPGLAHLALPAARRYAALAPSSAHALHMPSHIFTRLGLWGECIQANHGSVESARCYAEAKGTPGHWDEELHGLDYLVYAHLQRGETKLADQQWAYLNTIHEVHPANFKVAYAFAAIPARCLLENRRWAEAAALTLPASNVEWTKFPWQRALVHFTRLLGNAHLNHLPAARTELQALQQLQQTLVSRQETYQAAQVLRQMRIGQAWVSWREGHANEALRLLTAAADEEDQTEKHPVTPGEVLPARELLGDMYLALQRPREALAAYEASTRLRPNRFNGLNGAAQAAALAGESATARRYYQQLLAVAPGAAARPELANARHYLASAN